MFAPAIPAAAALAELIGGGGSSAAVVGGVLTGAAMSDLPSGMGSLTGNPAASEGLIDDGDEEGPACKPAIPDVSPNNLCEQLTLAEAKAGAGKIIMTNLADTPRLVVHYGPGPWVKKQHTHTCPDGRKLVVHYHSSLSSGKNVEMKFVNY